MKPSRIQHGIYKNLPNDTIYNSQAGVLIFALGVAFKLSAAPSVIAENYHSSTLWLYLILSAVELILTALIFGFVRGRSDGLLRATNNKAYRLCCGVCAIWLIAKGTFYFSYCAAYLAHEQFGGVEPALFYILLLAPIIYLGIKGSRSIARTAEIFVPIFFVLIVLNLVFLETDMDIERNMPIFAIEPKDFFAGLPRYGLWLGDAIPFAFLRIKNKRMPYVSTGIAVTFLIVNIIIFLGVAIYGEALKTVSDLLVRIAGFNQLSLDIGRMEWTNLFAVIALSILSLAFLYYGCTAAAERAVGFSLPAKIIFPIVVICCVLFSQSSQEIAQFSIDWIGYALCAVAVAIPILFFAIGQMEKRKFAGFFKCLDDEYSPHPPLRPDTPDSLADNVLAGMKKEAERTQTILQNGSLQPEESEQ
ncbi:MAG: GerAB/ArcD/ProY family transporter [Bacteroides sp.]|nr:GerAB/ArcD/ProY family transporter [Bacillota bacterium]MCM1394114.1 GerAB/ArcD/ProY family transporter [[Eubacterium] siraeum]MCM1455933.1 GerAB/ArcD/ProY family transporter [Bacteroides sp.]